MVKLTEHCFNSCVTKFRSKNMDSKEKTCVEMCTHKYLKLATRAGYRFADYQQALAVEQQQQQSC